MLCLAMSLTACSRLHPQMPDGLGVHQSFWTGRCKRVGESAYSVAEIDRDRERFFVALGEEVAAKNTEYVASRLIRDQMLWRMITDVSISYACFRTVFHEGRAGLETLADMAKLGMSAASATLGGSAALSAAVTALQGTQSSIDANFLGEKTTETIFVSMDALRDKQLAVIQTKLPLAPTAYGFDEAFNDAIALFNAGTVPSALQAMAASAGEEKKKATEAVDDAVSSRVLMQLPRTTRAVIDKTIDLAAVVDGLDESQRSNMIALINEQGGTLAPDTSLDDVRVAARRLVRNARTEAEVDALRSAFVARSLGE